MYHLRFGVSQREWNGTRKMGGNISLTHYMWTISIGELQYATHLDAFFLRLLLDPLKDPLHATRVLFFSCYRMY